MINFTLLKTTYKSNFITFLIILAVLFLYFPIIVSLYDPNSQQALNSMLEMFPPEFLNALGFSTMGESSLISFVSGYYYGFLIFLLPLIYVSIAANKSIASHVDRGSMAYLLSTPNSRKTIAFTQGFALLSSITLMIAILTIYGIIICHIQMPGELDIPSFLLINVGVLFLYYIISGIGFLASCIFNDSMYGVGFGTGIPIFFFVINMLAGINEKTSFLKNFTIYGFYNTTNIIQRNGYVLSFILMIGISVILYSAGSIIFQKRDLPL